MNSRPPIPGMNMLKDTSMPSATAAVV
jgi:hypothetical protein